MASRLSFLEFPPRHVEPSGSQGSVPTLVLLHAFPLHAGMWAMQRPLSHAGWRVIMPNVRGFGRGEEPTSLSMQDYASDVLALLDELGIDTAVIGGLSMGGYIALALYRRAPERFAGLLLADTRAEADSEQARANRERLIALAGTRGPSALADDMVPKLLGTTTQVARPAVSHLVRRMIADTTAPAIQSALTAMMHRADSRDVLGTIRVPTLIVVGEEDGLTPPEVHVQMASAIPGARLVRIPAAGHLSNLEQPQAFNDAVTACFGRR
ncbi:MAG: alpha/beta fold hydrolase [Vicinamibacterales bacterium]